MDREAALKQMIMQMKSCTDDELQRLIRLAAQLLIQQEVEK